MPGIILLILIDFEKVGESIWVWQIQGAEGAATPSALPSCIFPLSFLPMALICWTNPIPMKILDMPLVRGAQFDRTYLL